MTTYYNVFSLYFTLIIGASEIGSDLYLVANIIRVGKILHSESIKKGDKVCGTQCYRRPYGVGILSLSDISIDNSIDTEEKEFSFKVTLVFYTIQKF